MARFKLFGEYIAFGYFYQPADFEQEIGFSFVEITDERKLIECLFFPRIEANHTFLYRHNIFFSSCITGWIMTESFRNFAKNNLRYIKITFSKGDSIDKTYSNVEIQGFTRRYG